MTVNERRKYLKLVAPPRYATADRAERTRLLSGPEGGVVAELAAALAMAGNAPARL